MLDLLLWLQHTPTTGSVGYLPLSIDIRGDTNIYWFNEWTWDTKSLTSSSPFRSGGGASHSPSKYTRHVVSDVRWNDILMCAVGILVKRKGTRPTDNSVNNNNNNFFIHLQQSCRSLIHSTCPIPFLFKQPSRLVPVFNQSPHFVNITHSCPENTFTDSFSSALKALQWII